MTTEAQKLAWTNIPLRVESASTFTVEFEGEEGMVIEVEIPAYRLIAALKSKLGRDGLRALALNA